MLSGDHAFMASPLPLTPTTDALLRNRWYSLSTTLVSCWQWGHQVAKISINTGRRAVARTNSPDGVGSLKFGALSPIVAVPVIGAASA